METAKAPRRGDDGRKDKHSRGGNRDRDRDRHRHDADGALAERPLAVRLPACTTSKVALPPAPHAGTFEVEFEVEFVNASPKSALNLAMAMRIDGKPVNRHVEEIEEDAERSVRVCAVVDVPAGAVVSLTWRPFSRRPERLPSWLTIAHAEAHMRAKPIVAVPDALPAAAPVHHQQQQHHQRHQTPPDADRATDDRGDARRRSPPQHHRRHHHDDRNRARVDSDDASPPASRSSRVLVPITAPGRSGRRHGDAGPA